MSGKRSPTAQITKTCAAGLVIAILWGGIAGEALSQGVPFLTADDVGVIIRGAAEALDATTMIIAVTDREGVPLGIFMKPDAPDTILGNFGVPVSSVEQDDVVSAIGASGFLPPPEILADRISLRGVRFASRHLNWFTVGFDTADLKDAKALVDNLS